MSLNDFQIKVYLKIVCSTYHKKKSYTEFNIRKKNEILQLDELVHFYQRIKVMSILLSLPVNLNMFSGQV